MSDRVISERIKNVRLKCYEPDCTFESTTLGLVNITESDVILLANMMLCRDFQPTVEEETRLREIIGDQHTCPTHGHKNLRLVVTSQVVTEFWL